MNLPLPPMRSLRDAVCLACLLEAKAPKVGNVSPGKSFSGLSYQDFVVGAEIVSEELTRTDRRVSQRMHSSVTRTMEQTGTNVNLGIVLLLGPLVDAALRSKSGELSGHVASVLSDFDLDDGQRVFEMIDLASRGSTGAQTRHEDRPPESHDVSKQAKPVDLMAAMRMASDRDRIARQYCTGFQDLFDQVVPVLEAELRSTGDILSGVAGAHLELLCREPDSLIARKQGRVVAEEVQRRAQTVDSLDPDSISTFDDWLRSNGNQLNPGTTADLIAAALFVLLIRISPLLTREATP